MKPLFSKLFTFAVLLALAVSAFVIRWDNVQKSRNWTIDEIVYARMARQMRENPYAYNTIAYGHDLASTGRPLPDYFFAPLYKHPPVFTAAIAGTFRLLGTHFKYAILPSLIMGVLAIPVIYLLGSLVFSRSIGLLAALLLWMDPVSIICSQKIWPDSMIAFFTLLAVTGFAWAVIKNAPGGFVVAGIATGLAINTKYSAGLILVVFIGYAVLYNRGLFRQPVFRISMALPILMLTPWILWNVAVYGSNNILSEVSHHDEVLALVNLIGQQAAVIMVAFVILALLSLVITKVKKTSTPAAVRTPRSRDLLQYTSYVIAILLAHAVLKTFILNSLSIDHAPTTTWQQSFFRYEPPVFYFGRLIEFNLVYLFGFIGLFTFHPRDPKESGLIRLSAGAIIIFFILWGNFQSRYILPSIPFMLLLSSHMIVKAWDAANRLEHLVPRLAVKGSLAAVILYAVMKTALLNAVVSFPNNMCYF